MKLVKKEDNLEAGVDSDLLQQYTHASEAPNDCFL